MKRRVVGALALATALGSPGTAQPETRTLAALFPLQAPLSVTGEGLARLLVPPAVLAECRPDLSDVRIVDAAGREIPYLVDADRRTEDPLEVATRRAAEVLDVALTTVERDEAPNLQREVYRLASPEEEGAGEPAAGPGWEIEVASPRSRFVRRVKVSQGDSLVVADASIFRLPQPAAAKTQLALPALGSGDLTVEIEGEEGFFLEPTFTFERRLRLAGRQAVRVDLEVTAVHHFDDRTELEIERPAGLVPDMLVLGTATPSFSRRVEVWDEGARSAAAAVGSASLFRLAAGAEVERLEIELAAVRGDRLRVVIDNGDSPPLEGVTLSAAIQQPALIFPSSSVARLLFGGGRARRPRYDLAALGPSLPASGVSAEVAAQVYDPQRLATATVGEVTPNPFFDPTPALSFAMRPGAALDVRRYSHRQPFTARPSAEGLVRLDLGLDLLAAARADLADLRIVDGAGRQWPYLIERHAAVATRELRVRGPRTADRESRYALELPVRPAVLEEVVLYTAVPYFDRSFELDAETADGTKRRMASGRLARRQGDPRPLHISLGDERLTALELVVPNGDDAPLELERAEGSFPVSRVYLAAPDGEYALLTGFPDDQAPVYELSRVRDVVLAVPAADARLAPLGRNADFSARARLAGTRGLQGVLLWVAIVLAVGSLVWMTLRLARSEGR
jgi:hypothetical protein